MLNKKNIIIGIAISIFLGIAFHFINQKLNLPDDNLIEEEAEKIIFHSFMINLDLTPFTPENHD